jgi:hypothetical protein
MAVNLNTPSEKAAGLYVAYFNRKPDASGLEFWSKKFAEGTGADEAAARFADSDEAKLRFEFLARDLDGEDGSFSEEEAGQVVDQIYQNVLGREPDEDGREFWIQELQSGTDVGQVVIQVLFGAQGQDADLIESAVQTRLQEVEGDRDEGVTIEGDDGDNTLEGSDRDDELSGLAGNDTLRGLAGDDVLNGGEGDDTLNGGPGDDELTGGAGADEFVFDLAGNSADETDGADDSDADDGSTDDGDADDGGTEDGSADDGGADSTDAVGPPEGKGPPSNRGPNRGEESPEEFDGDGEIIQAGNGPDRVEGTEKADYISGGNGPDQLFGLAGDDTLTGGNGPDTLVGGEGNDTMTGGLGPDRFRFEGENTGDDVITDFFAPTDTLVFDLSGGSEDSDDETQTRVTESTIEITVGDGSIADGDTLSLTVGGNELTVTFSGNQDASGVAAAIASAAGDLANVENASADSATVTLTATADGDVEVSDFVDNTGADITAETTVVSETEVSQDDSTDGDTTDGDSTDGDSTDDGSTDDSASSSASVQAPLTIEIETDGDGEITEGDTVSVVLNGDQTLTATLSGGEDANGIASALASVLAETDAIADATVGEDGTIAVTAAEGEDVDLTDFAFSTEDDVTVEGEIEPRDDDDDEDEDDEDVVDEEDEDDADEDEAALDLPEGVTATQGDNGVVIEHAGGTVTLQNVSLDELDNGNFKFTGEGENEEQGIGDDVITDFSLEESDQVRLNAGDGEDAVTMDDLSVEAYTNDAGETVGVTLDTTEGEITIIGDVTTDTPISDYVTFGG